MRATVRQIAKRSHVSPATVSRVLNNHPHVDEQTRAAVMQVAAQLGYDKAPRVAPRVFRSILLLVRDENLRPEQEISLAGREFERSVLIALQPVFEQHGIAARLQRTRMEPDEVRSYTNDLGIAGLILLGGVINHDFVLELQKASVPFVVVGAHVQPLLVNCVVADYVSGMEQAVTHLASVGRERIGLVNGPPTTSSSGDKYRGYRLGLALHDLAFDPSRVVCGDFDAESGYVRTQDLLRTVPDLDAIAYAQDTMALGGLRAIKESGRRVPQDMAVTGFYDYEIARFTDPPLTTVHFDIQMMGAIAAHRLCMLLDDPDPQCWMASIPTALVVRSSTGENASRVSSFEC